MPTLVLVRHGQSEWNLENRFTGWWDVDITDKGAEEARLAGELMAAKGLDFDLCLTSVQIRAIKTLHIALERRPDLLLVGCRVGIRSLQRLRCLAPGAFRRFVALGEQTTKRLEKHLLQVKMQKQDDKKRRQRLHKELT